MADFRSDTVTQPCAEMRAAMAAAECGDDVYGEDPTVERLEDFGASLLGKEAALLCPSGTQSNLVGLLAHCGRGDEYIVGAEAHTYRYEGGGAAVLGSIQPQPIAYAADGVSLPLDAIEAAIKPDDPHYARTKLVCLENTRSGRCLPRDYAPQVRQLAERYGLAMHLDGARLFNAFVAQGVPASELAGPFDTVSICLSKGLGAPMGSLLVGTQSLVDSARRWRKVLGGGMRQVGIVAAAGLYALEHNIDRLAEDHRLASQLADGLRAIGGLQISEDSGETNMVFVTVPEASQVALFEAAAEEGIKLPGGPLPGANNLRLLTHKDLGMKDIEALLDLFRRVMDD